ncbi:MAG: SDR family NAD(P)-dependent oxidoreductase [Bryobacteraceae bacterium]
MNPFSLSSKTALIAGASRGIGLAIARYLSAAGARTILAARSADALEKNCAELRAGGAEAEALVLDVTSMDSIRSAAASLPPVDILVNVSGTNVRKQFERFTDEEWQRVMRTNLDGIVEVTRAVGAKMVERGGGGKIVMIGSLMSLLGLPYLTAYAVSKSGLYGLTRVLAAEWARYNIQVNLIAPGFIITDLNRAMWQRQEMKDWLKGVQANPRPGKPEDVAGLAVFLSSAASDYVTGQAIAVDGGYSTTRMWPFEP